MRDIVFPSNNVQEFVSMAEKLGYSGLVLAYTSSAALAAARNVAASKIKIQTALVVEPKQVQSARGKADLVIVRASATENDRYIFEKAKPDIVFDLELSTRQDKTHQRYSGMNHILAKLAHDNNLAVGFSFASILNSSGFRRAQILGRMAQNIALCRKYKVNTLIASFAKSPWEMRAHGDIKALFGLLGLR